MTRYIPHRATERQGAYLVLDKFLPPDEPSEALYGGAAGGGKSDALLMAGLQYVDVPGYAGILFRRTYADLALPGALMARSHEWLRGTDAHWNGTDKTWSFPSGATLSFGYLQHAGDEYRYQSAEFQFVGFDELTQFPDEQQYVYLRSRVRRPSGLEDNNPLAQVPLRLRVATNPGGVGHIWVSRRFIDPEKREPGSVFIPAQLKDNPHIDQRAYEASLSHLPEILRRQLLDGDWGAFEGAAFTDFDPIIHCVASFPLSPDLARSEGMDYGLNHPTAWYLVPTDYDGNLVFYDRIYQPGLPSEIAPLVRQKYAAGWGDKNDRHADPSIWRRIGSLNKWGQPASIASEFDEHGVTLQPANNDPRAGYTRLRELLKPDPERRFPDWHPLRGQSGSPRMFIVAGACPELVEQFSTAPIQPTEKRDGGEIVDPIWEGEHGHAIAAARYLALSKPGPTSEPVKPIDNPRAEALRRHEEKLDTAPPRRRKYVNA